MPTKKAKAKPRLKKQKKAATKAAPGPKSSSFFDLLDIVKTLRGPNGCPWDKAQTHKTLTPYAIEETHELVEAIELADQDMMIEELGDVLLQVVLHSEIARQEKRFDINDVVQRICKKMISRHPHVFGEKKAKTAQEAVDHFLGMKESEKKLQRKDFAIPVSMPALQRSHKIGVKTQREGFDWNSAQEVFGKVKEELQEFETEIQAQKKEGMREELGDLLFSMAQLARHMDMEPEQVLREANQKFETRYFKMKKLAEKKKLNFSQMTMNDKEELWQESKRT